MVSDLEIRSQKRKVTDELGAVVVLIGAEAGLHRSFVHERHHAVLEGAHAHTYGTLAATQRSVALRRERR